MRLEFIWVGKTRDSSLQKLEERYCERVSRYFPVRMATIRDRRRTDSRQSAKQDAQESDSISRRVTRPGFIIVLDEAGEQSSSTELAGFLDRLIQQGRPSVTFVIGGPSGLPSQTKKEADRVLSLSRMTFPHELSRVMLLEQVYRAATILKGLPYHK